MPAPSTRPGPNGPAILRIFVCGFTSLLGFATLPGLSPALLEAQLIRVSQPLTSTSDSFFNRTGIQFGMSFAGNSRIRGYNAAGQITPNIDISQNSIGSTIPPFGGYDPNAALRTGFAVIGGNGGFSLGLVAGKGNTRSLVSSTPSVTMFNGQSGSIFSGQLRPFVTGITPVIGNSSGVGMVRPLGLPQGFRVSGNPERPLNVAPQTYTNPDSTATQGALSLAEISRLNANRELQQQSEWKAEIESLVADARRLVNKQKFGAARAKFSRAIRKLGESAETSGIRNELTAELDAIRDRR